MDAVVPSPSPQDQRTGALAAAREGARILRTWQGRFTVQTKKHASDFVTEADREAEVAILAHLQARFPHDSIRGEEGAAVEGTSGRTWWIDPLDGTLNYVRGIPLWCVSVGCEDEHGPLCGAVINPTTGDMWSGHRDLGLYAADTPYERPAGAEQLADALLLHIWGWDARGGDWRGELARRLYPRFMRLQAHYSTAMMLTWVACGYADVYLADSGVGLNAWDLMGGLALSRAAGLQTQQLHLEGRTQTVVTSGALMPLVMDALVDSQALEPKPTLGAKLARHGA